jgi:benzoate/toluate 1,2-dioxygenase reductase component
LFLAGGTGIGPILAMLEQLAAQRADDHSVRLLYGVRHEPDLVELERISAFARRLSKFSYSTCCSRPESKHSPAGYVTDHFSADALNGGDIDVYLCGPPEMVEGGRRRLTELGLSASNVYLEKFAAAQP